jgi:formamidopyrimidine-DNA glycosylase
MIAGRLHWRSPGAKVGGRNNLAAFDFLNGSLVLTEAGTKRRASLHLFHNEEEMQSIDPGGIDIFAIDVDGFRAALTAENRTLKRSLTDPRILSGIGNAYSDEILHAAQLSPILQTHKLTPEVRVRLFTATREIVATLHPSAILRARTDEDRERDTKIFQDDLRRVTYFFEEITLLFSMKSRWFALRLRQSLIDSLHLHSEHKENIL